MNQARVGHIGRGVAASVVVLGIWLEAPMQALGQGRGAAPPSVVEPEKGVPTPIIAEPPSMQRYSSYKAYELGDLKRRIRVTRNAWIGTSVATAVGAAFLFPGLARQCVSVRDFDGTEELDCTASGKALVGLGYPLFIGGLAGALITGILFGVRKGKIRRAPSPIARTKSRPLHWDPATSQVLF